MCCNLPLSKMLQNYCFTYPQKKKKRERRKKAPKLSGFLLCKIFYLNVDAWQNSLGNLQPPC